MATEALRHRAEEACLKGWPALREKILDGWLLRFSGGHTRRANSVNPLVAGSEPLADKIGRCERLYEEAGLPTIFRIPSMAEPGLDASLDARGYGPAEDETRVIYVDFARHPPRDDDDAYVLHAPSAEWFEAHAHCSGSSAQAQQEQRDILHALAVPAVFTGLRGDDGRLGALAFGAVHDRILCLNLVVTDPALRRRGLSRRVVSSVLHWARERAEAEGACLPVVATNTPAIALTSVSGSRPSSIATTIGAAQRSDAESGRPAQIAKEGASA
ncbi:MAG TPA: GNAT family N-acetyltransferase [Stellaceae bacterium]|nr:GNAT family N-acetyltransferase [Stellaceae bacterium]